MSSLSIPISPQFLSSTKTLCPISLLSLTTQFSSHLSFKTTPIRMGGGPRTFPGGVSKWQWKRMQAKKAKQLLKARLARERQIYEMRKRAELKAAVSELERPWEIVEKPPTLFSVSADEQLKVLADRFQKPGGLDLWSDRDGPELFRPDNGLPSARFFPKGVVHSVKPYGKIAELSTGCDEFGDLDVEEGFCDGNLGRNDSGLELGKGRNVRDLGSDGVVKKGLSNGPFNGSDMRKSRRNDGRLDLDEGRNVRDLGSDGVVKKGKIGMRGNRKKGLSDSAEINSTNVGFSSKDDGRNRRIGDSGGQFRRSKGYEKGGKMKSEVFDMSLQNDGTYGFELEN